MRRTRKKKGTTLETGDLVRVPKDLITGGCWDGGVHTDSYSDHCGKRAIVIDVVRYPTFFIEGYGQVSGGGLDLGIMEFIEHNRCDLLREWRVAYKAKCIKASEELKKYYEK